MSYVTDAVRKALDDQNMVTATTNVKRLVCDELAHVDPTARIHNTDYFNHSYVPDFVLNWDKGDTREVFLRFVSAPQRLLADIERIGVSGPVIYDLSLAAPMGTGSDKRAGMLTAFQQLEEGSPRLLITDSEATQYVRPRDANNVVERLVTANLLRSGRGNLDESTACNTVAKARAGYDAAIAARPAGIQAVAMVARQILDPETNRRVERTLQLLWWVGGGASKDFPINIPDDMELNPSDTQDFLREVFADEQAIEDDTFWSRLADRLSFDTLVDVGDFANSENLHRLMSQFAGCLCLSHVILDKRERPFPPFDQLAWSLEDKFLRLRGPEWICRFTPHGNRFSQRKNIGRPITLSEADKRSTGYRIDDVRIEEATREVVLSRKDTDHSQPLGGRSLQDLAAGFADDAAVRAISVFLGESLMTADFDRMMVGADPDATVRDLAFLATKLLAGLDGDDEVELAAFLDS